MHFRRKHRVVAPHFNHLGNRTLVITSHCVQACKSYGVIRKTMDGQRDMKTLPVHYMVGKSSCHLNCMSCSQLCHKPTGFLVTINRSVSITNEFQVNFQNSHIWIKILFILMTLSLEQGLFSIQLMKIFIRSYWWVFAVVFTIHFTDQSVRKRHGTVWCLGVWPRRVCFYNYKWGKLFNSQLGD